MGALISTVHVHDYPPGGKNVFSPGDDVPEWAAKQMGAHCFEDVEHPYPADGEKPADDSGDQPPDGSPPPMVGKGSNKEAWAAYAAAIEVDISGVPFARDPIIKAIVDAGKSVD